jgi:hypothetical protein
MTDRFTRILDSRFLWLALALAMAALAARVPEWTWPPSSGQIASLVICAFVAAILASPQSDRPVHHSNSWAVRALQHRNALLSAGFAAFIASNRPNLLEAWIDALLLAVYLLLLDAVTMPARVFQRMASPLFLGGLVALICASAAILALHGSTSAGRRIGVAAIALALVAAGTAAAFTPAETRRVGSRRLEPPESDHHEVPR